MIDKRLPALAKSNVRRFNQIGCVAGNTGIEPVTNSGSASFNRNSGYSVNLAVNPQPPKIVRPRDGQKAGSALRGRVFGSRLEGKEPVRDDTSK